MSIYIDQFFKALSERFYKENDLSDITASILSSSETFSAAFISFISNGLVPAGPYEVLREFTLDESNRPDFVFMGDRHIILLENKIWDMDYHFPDYRQALTNYLNKNNAFSAYQTTLCLISAHRLSGSDLIQAVKHGFSVVYWDDLSRKLRELVSSATFELDEASLINGYTKYVEEVVRVPDIGRVQFTSESLKSITYMVRLMKTIIRETSHQDFDIQLDARGGRIPSELSAGTSYSIQKISDASKVFANFYLQYEYKGRPSILIDLPMDWNPNFNSKILLIKSPDFDFELPNIKNREGCAFILKKDRYDDFLTADQANQKQILKDFFDSVNGVIESYL